MFSQIFADLIAEIADISLRKSVQISAHICAYLREKNLYLHMKITYDIAIIGAGPAGYKAAERAGQSGLKTLLFDKEYLGGVCLNEGCIPIKTLLYTSRLFKMAKDGVKYGIHAENIRYDLSAIMRRKNKVVKKLVGGVENTLKKFGVEIIYEKAFIKGKTKDTIIIESTGNEFHAKNLIIATGSEPMMPGIPGLESRNFYTSREILQLSELPDEITILGAGYIGIELAAFFSAMGTKVTVVELMPDILPGIDKELSQLLKKELSASKVEFKLGIEVVKVEKNNLVAKSGFESKLIPFKNLLICIGRKPSVQNLGLENLDIEYHDSGIKTDHQCRTNIPHVYAAGDVNGLSMLAHTAYREAEVVVNNIIGNKDMMRYEAVPWVVYTSPEIATVGMTGEMAKEQDIEYEVRKLPMAYSGRFVAENEGKNGFAKIIIGKKYRNVLGMHLIGNPASEMIYGAGMMIENEMRIQDIEEIIFPHPTVSEILRETVFAFRG
jgi:dihydrolipoamide dehydrogenase